MWLPKPRLRQSAKEYVVGGVQAADEGTGWSEESVGGDEESGEVAAVISESPQFLSYGSDHIDKAGRLPNWCEDDEDEGKDVGLETLLAADGAVEAATDALVAAELAEEVAELIAWLWIWGSSAGDGGSSAGI